MTMRISISLCLLTILLPYAEFNELHAEVGRISSTSNTSSASKQSAKSPPPTRNEVGVVPPLPSVDGTMSGTVEGTFKTTDMGASTYIVPLAVSPGTAELHRSIIKRMEHVLWCCHSSSI